MTVIRMTLEDRRGHVCSLKFILWMAGQTDSSGIRLWVTKDLRQWDAGLIESGVLPHMFHLIPPGDLSFASLGVCSTSCLEQV